MMPADWRWKINEAIERLRNQYVHIGRTTGAPFLAVTYPVEAEMAFFQEWRTQTDALRHELDVRHVDVLGVTQTVLNDIGAENIVAALADPMPGSNPEAELGHLWVKAVTDSVGVQLAQHGAGKLIVSVERLAALHPAASPRDVMQAMWDTSQLALDCPIVVLIPGVLKAPRVYSFLGLKDEFMYRGDVL